ncbi:hypothetical protein L249_6793 [Ophiocordyceps polyrhachis-furcata BCC 54312]|uniref:Signal peptide-containing protein n=1 Tax=Ophiocordyceps polyrhachis-furcata BCC 54312 TaxID=1330021 RepID=A0A367LL87_9HYPO|nr:hypothetical protein L249_6793 [Ophiocordyceps polyrhachis-furcata BCC 54312]
MSFPVAFQSAVFYFVACTPCAKVRHRHKAKDQARKERQEKSRLETEQPGLYRHPSPFNTNPYWQEEINMGPSLPKKSASKNSSQRGLASSGRESTVPSMSDHTNAADSPPDDDAGSEDWNRRRGYQREDEELWGQLAQPPQSHKLKVAFSRARGSAGRLIDATLGIEKEVTAQDRHDFYLSPRNPPVNDYHPPVVSSKPPHRDARRWMLQPPPPAKVMEGKVPVSRAVSSGSKSSDKTLAPEDPQFGRVLDDELAEEPGRAHSLPDNPTESELIDSLFRARRRQFNYHNHYLTRSRSLSLDDSEDSASNVLEKRRRSRRRPRHVPPTTDSEDDEGTTSRMTEAVSHSTSSSSHAAQRPRLETIPSSGGGSYRSSHKSPKRPKARRSRTTSWANSPVGDDTE